MMQTGEVSCIEWGFGMAFDRKIQKKQKQQTIY